MRPAGGRHAGHAHLPTVHVYPKGTTSTRDLIRAHGPRDKGARAAYRRQPERRHWPLHRCAYPTGTISAAEVRAYLGGRP